VVVVTAMMFATFLLVEATNGAFRVSTT